jgi:hypothetical protein
MLKLKKCQVTVEVEVEGRWTLDLSPSLMALAVSLGSTIWLAMPHQPAVAPAPAQPPVEQRK